MIRNLSHINYEKIVDRLMFVSGDWVLEFVTLLSSCNDKRGREMYHSETMYSKGNANYCNIKRAIDCYFLLKYVKRVDDGMPPSAMIRPCNMYPLRYALNEIEKWFTQDVSKAFKKDQEIIRPNNTVNRKIVLNSKSYLEWIPEVCIYGNGHRAIGCRVFVNSDYTSVFMTTEKFFEFKYIMDTFQMNQAAMLAINYLGRPEFGTNLYDCTSNTRYNDTSLQVDKPQSTMKFLQ